MNKKWIWAVLALATLVATIALGQQTIFKPRQPVPGADLERRGVEAHFPQTPSPAVAEKAEGGREKGGGFPAVAPQVDRDRLLAHLKALGFQRYQAADRQQARSYILQTLRDAGWAPQSQPFAGGVNLVATRPGTVSQAGTILVAAHYDTVQQSPGVDDNATGVATVLELARLLRPISTPRTLQVALFDQEEAGLQGSLAFASQTNPATLAGVVVLEMLGYACHTSGCQRYPADLPIPNRRDQGDFVAIVGDQEHPALLTAFAQAQTPTLPPVVTLAVPFKGLATPDLLRSDHAPFWYQGIGAVMVTDTANFRTPHYHQPSDTLAHLDRPFFTGVAQLTVKAVMTLLTR